MTVFESISPSTLHTEGEGPSPRFEMTMCQFSTSPGLACSDRGRVSEPREIEPSSETFKRGPASVDAEDATTPEGSRKRQRATSARRPEDGKRRNINTLLHR